ncbi:DUF1254 domain-containing protein [Variovorax sp. J22P271]|uniref:DUF1254 domain-containing protein n=1 Tax=Variovorax davisae TaxID=3053515 RepID=UPI002576AB27|nr:DUF1254 domain-containing protein [Variovorax sp. J22P271]MDM0032344.1 DUF1254 domain-containing protein [Variovorax sp. J22P271]
MFKHRLLTALACLLLPFAASHAAVTVNAEQARAIAKEAYIYGYPMVDSYRVEYGYFVDQANPEFKGPWNQITNVPRVYTPKDIAIQTPNSDTPYSFVGLDLRAEPMVLTLPPIDKGRYFSVQLIDAYTFNFGYLGSRATGNAGGSYLIAGPHWHGATPKGIKKVLRSESDLVMAIYRTQLLSPDDLDKVKEIQAGYKVAPLSAFIGGPAPKAPPAIEYIKPLSQADQKGSLAFFDVLNFVLQFAPTHPSEKALMAHFSKIGVGPGQHFDADKSSPEIKMAIQQGMNDAWQSMGALSKQFDQGKLSAGDLFGTRESMKNNYLNRMLATIGIYGNSKEEALYPVYGVDANGQPLDGSNRYTLHFAAGQLPPVNAFWSLTMYELPASLLVENPLSRYLINSPMLPKLKRDPDGGLTLYIQQESPGKDKEANWLPAPKGPFNLYMRLYWPKEAALKGSWKAPKLNKV